ncbi:MAG TPA: substrate-binding domain-containing protein [Candidatus Acidoferrales bacterium]|nr:substrate-binding domain-containing protein [Candidatus Acidoferrales bacterium]
MRKRLTIVCLLVVAVATSVFATDFAVIVNPANPVRQMSLADLGKIFKAKTTAWTSGKPITIVLRDPGSSGTRFIIEKVLGGSFDEDKALLTSSNRKSSVPVIFADSDEQILKIVESDPGAIGVIDVYNITSGVNVVKIDDKQPFDPGYVLKGR